MKRDDRHRPAISGAEIDLLRGYLQHQRDTLVWKSSGLDHAALNRTHPPSTLTAAGLLKHMAFVESYWFSQIFAGGGLIEPFDSADWDADRDWEFTTAPADSPAVLFDLYARACAESDRVLSACASLDQVAAVPREKSGGSVSLRWILLHMIEEYARHNGHLDLIREAIDGLTGA